MGICSSKKASTSPEKRYAQYKTDDAARMKDEEVNIVLPYIDPFEKTETNHSSHNEEATVHPLTPSTVASSSTQGSPYQLVPIATTRKGRALRSRLEKFKHMQELLLANNTTPMSQNPNRNGHSLYTTVSLESPASAVIVSPDGGYYVGTEDGSIFMADGHSIILKYRKPVKCLLLLPNSNLAVAVADATLILDNESLQTIYEIPHDDRVYALTVCRNHLITAGFSSAVHFYHMESFEYEFHIERDGLILCMDTSLDDRLAVGGSDKIVAIVSPKGEVLREMKRSSTILAVKWSSTRLLAVASKDSIGVYDANGKLYELNVQSTTGVAWSPSGRYLCQVAPHGSALYMDETVRHTFSQDFHACDWGQFGTLVLAGEETLHVLRAGETTVDDASSTASYFSNRGDWVLKEDAFVDLDAETPNDTVQEAPERDIVALAFSKGSKFRPSSYLAVSTEEENLVIVRNGTDYSLVAELEFPATVAAVAFSYGSRYLALGCHDARVYIYDTTANWELVTTIEFAEPITSLCFTVRNEWLFVGSLDGTVAYLNAEQEFDFEDEIEGYESGVTSLDCSPKHVAAGRDDGVVNLFALDNLETPLADLHRDSPVTSICFGVNSRFLAVGDAEGLVGVYSAKGGWVLSHQIEMDNSICMVRWCAQGRHLAVSDVAGSIKVFDTIFWQEIEAARKPHDPSGSKYIDFSQDGKYLAIGSDRVLVVEAANEWEPILNTLDKSKKDP